MKKKAVDSKSFVQNIFRGLAVPDQAFPYPQPLDEEQKENLQMLVPIAERVMAEQNDPLVNDAQESVPEATVQALRELGAFGLQVKYWSFVFLLSVTETPSWSGSRGVGRCGSDQHPVRPTD